MLMCFLVRMMFSSQFLTTPPPPNTKQETAMGSAIECFDDAGAVVVPRSRFAPVKTCNDLFALRSDAYKVGGFYFCVRVCYVCFACGRGWWR